MSAPGKGILGRVAGAATGRVVEFVDPDVILEYVDLDQLIERIDVQRIVDRIDPNVLMDRIDVQRLLSRVDLNEVMAGVDLDLLLARVDLEAVVQRSGVPDIIMASTGRFADSAVDLGRRQVVGVDALVDRGVDRLLRRPADRTVAPEHLRDDTSSTDMSSTNGSRTSVTGHYAGPLGRALAAVVDVVIITAAFAAGYFVTDLLTTHILRSPAERRPVAAPCGPGAGSLGLSLRLRRAGGCWAHLRQGCRGTPGGSGRWRAHHGPAGLRPDSRVPVERRVRGHRVTHDRAAA